MKRRNFLKIVSGSAVALSWMMPSGILRGDAARRPPASMPDDDPKQFTGEDVFNRLVKMADELNWQALPIGELIAAVALELRGTPYVGATLELYDDREVCSVNFLGLDCVTLFETALDFARMIKRGAERTPAALLAQITYTRYRNGKLGDYTSRLHYTTDWFYDNEQKSVVKVITRELPGAVRFTRTVNFMSTHPDSYRQLKSHPKLVPVIAEMERLLNARTMYYIPKEDVPGAELHLKTGDIIGITTTINGIDCSHTGLCYRDQKGVLRFLHASLDRKEVTLDDRLSAYLARITKHTGIMVARPMET